MLQRQLDFLYQQTWTKLNAALPKDRGISNPLFIHVPEAYETAELKLMVIGKETHSWAWHLGDPDHPTSVEKLVAHYREFNLGEKYVKSPFWWAAHELQRQLTPAVPPFGFVWSNLFICDQNCKTPENDIGNKLRELSILKEELGILQPDAVVFLTGWYPYDYTIKKLFPGIVMTPEDGDDGKLLSRLSHPALPVQSYRTYHPKYLRLKRKMSVLDLITSKIRNYKNS
ncbi:MAG: hypothetical protein LV479_03620 [Methylacidiphilales bacterium]|nr:hypothetical protein [Candidatus Methylacidiphilales bacterium]